MQVALDAIEYGGHYTVVKAVHDGSTEDVATFASALGQFGLADMAALADQARRRLSVLDDRDRLISNPAAGALGASGAYAPRCRLRTHDER